MSTQTADKISTLKATMMGINIMIGAGILSGPAIMAMAAGSASFLAWILTAIILLPVVYNVARLPEAIPGAGGIYLYCKEGFGGFGGFLGGWLYFIAMSFSATAILSAFRNSFLVFYPDMFVLQNKLVFLLVCLSLMLLLNLIPASTSATIQSYLTYFKLVPIFAAIFLLPFFIKNGISISLSDVVNVPKAVPLAIFGFIGFEYCCNISHLVKGGPAAAKRAILTGFLFVAALYALFHFSVLVIMGTAGLISMQASGYATFVGHRFPLIASILAYLLPISTLITYVNSTNGLTFLNSINLQSFGNDKILRFSNYLTDLNSNGRPWISVIISLIFMLSLGLSINDTQRLAIGANLSVVFLLVISTLALIKVEWHKAFDFDRGMAILGVCIGLGLVAFNWTCIAPTNAQRAMGMLPLFIGLALGLVLFNPSAQLSVQNKKFF